MDAEISDSWGTFLDPEEAAVSRSAREADLGHRGDNRALRGAFDVSSSSVNPCKAELNHQYPSIRPPPLPVLRRVVTTSSKDLPATRRSRDSVILSEYVAPAESPVTPDHVIGRVSRSEGAQ
jgi:hypothetical protein